jgi:hypothetical protein
MRVLLLLATLCAASPVLADSPADSAAAARTWWRAARDARILGDHTGAMLKAQRAHAAWPMQWYYAYGSALMAAEAGEPTAAARALDDLAAIGVGMDTPPDSALAALAKSSLIVNESWAKVRANMAPLAASVPRIEFPKADSAFWPEGLAWDGKTKRFFLPSVRQHKVVAVGDDGVPHDFATTGALGALAVATDVKRRRLWVTSAAIPQAGAIAPGDSGKAVIEAFDLDTGKSLTRIPFPPVRGFGHIPGDVCVAPGGEVFITDSEYPAIYRLSFGMVLVEWLTDPAFRSLQGQAISPDGNQLFVADYSTGIAAIDTATRGIWWLIPPAGVSILGIDGLAFGREELFGVQNGISPPRIVRMTLGREVPRGPFSRIAQFTVLDRNVPLADEPTMGVLVGDYYTYVANSQWEKYDDSGARKEGTVLTPPRLLTVPLKKGKKK